MKKKTSSFSKTFHEKMNHGFTGIWLPAEIIENGDLSHFEKILFGYIHSLSKARDEKGKLLGCFASNEHLAEVFCISIKTIEASLKNLRDEKLIRTKNFNGRKRVMETLIKTGGK